MAERSADSQRVLADAPRVSRIDQARDLGLTMHNVSNAETSNSSLRRASSGGRESSLIVGETRSPLASVEEIIHEARNGRMFILVDDEDRENEGDLIIPAQMVTSKAINFMATHGRGLICLCLTEERCRSLELPMMAEKNETALATAFTVSIEASKGVSTGISAADRAHTIRVAIDGSNGKSDIVTPGHVFPLQARKGGVLVRAGHTEASVDISRLAGLNPSAVICEIMRDDGEMARLDDLIAFALKHDLKIGTIKDLIEYRRCNDRIIERLKSLEFESEFGGLWQMASFRNKVTGEEALALVKGDIKEDQPTLVRMHTLSVLSDSLGRIGERKNLLRRSMEIIAEEGRGAIVVVNKSMKGLFSDTLEMENMDGARMSGPASDIREYGVGAQILAELGVYEIVLLTNSRLSRVALTEYGLRIIGVRPIN
jgi:3,4-dihydroxy 2-butanone 4-phosphate synthase / GTP cyclohydrolase II